MQQYTRRVVVVAAAQALVGALLSACSGGKSPTSPPAPTGAASGTAPASTVGAVPATSPATGAASASGIAPTGATAVAASAPVGTQTVSTVATTTTGTPSDLLRMLAFVPDNSVAGKSLSFANISVPRQLYGFGTIHSFADFDAQGLKLIDFSNAIGGCYLSDFIGFANAQGRYRDAFGYDIFQIDREISGGLPPGYFSRMEGAFDVGAVTAKLQAAGYQNASAGGTDYFMIRDDYQIDIKSPNGSIALARMNRVAVSKERIVAAPATPLITAALNAEAKKTPTLDQNPAYRALALALGGVTSMTTLPADSGALDPAAIVRGGSTDPQQIAAALREYTNGWGTLAPAELTAMGYTDQGNNQRTMHVALVYPNPADAATNAPELVKRLRGYRSVLTQQPIMPKYVTAVVSRTVTDGTKSVLVADLTLASVPTVSRFWLQMYQSRDTLFLASGPLTLPGASGSPAVTGTATARP